MENRTFFQASTPFEPRVSSAISYADDVGLSNNGSSGNFTTVKQGANEVRAALVDLMVAGQLAESAWNNSITGIRDVTKSAFKDIVSGTVSLSDGVSGALGQLRQVIATQLGNFSDQLLQQVLDNTINPIIDNTFKSIFGNLGSGGNGGSFFGDILQSGFNFVAGLFHDGGIVGRDGGRRVVSPSVFSGSNVFRTTGGIGPNEFPAVLQRGEEVLTPADPRHQFNLMQTDFGRTGFVGGGQTMLSRGQLNLVGGASVVEVNTTVNIQSPPPGPNGELDPAVLNQLGNTIEKQIAASTREAVDRRLEQRSRRGIPGQFGTRF